MNEGRDESDMIEQEKREVGAGEVVPGSGRRGTSRRMAQMISVRLDGELVGRLRDVAREREVTLSELLREGAEVIAANPYAVETRVYYTTFSNAKLRRSSHPDEGLALAR
ncbi:MAG: hypothetical protein ACR2N0_10525 [Rubrobacteraceae bacterium]|jgi:hypothetical protein